MFRLLSISGFPAIAVFIYFLIGGCNPVQNTSRQRQNILSPDKIFQQAVIQYKFLKEHLPHDSFPKTWNPVTGIYEWSTSQWWCSGFYPGTLIMLYEQTGDSTLNTEASRMLNLLRKEQFNKGTHDLGFMMYCSFGHALKIHPSKDFEEVLVNSARSLSSRFSPVTGCIRSWNSGENDFLVIIDNMMNLELLFEATRITGDSSFHNIAVTHANTTMKNHYRPDYSSWHVINYDDNTGAVKQKKTAQGYSDGSAWARGQAWGLYGFTMTYRETRRPEYLQQAEHIADFILNHPHFPKDGIPFWDFDAPDIPDALRDASAAAIIASALMELCTYVPIPKSGKYLSTAELILKTLSSPDYLAAPETNGGFLLKHGVGHLPNHTEVDVPLSYADYYFIEALGRYKAFSR